MTNIRRDSGNTPVLNRFSEHFSTYVFRDHDDDHALLLDLVNSACEDKKSPKLQGRFTSFTLNPELTAKFFAKEHTWIVVGEGTTDRNEQATVVLQLFRHPTFELTFFVSDCGELHLTRDEGKSPDELKGLSPDRPLVVISLFMQAMCRHDHSPAWHQLMINTWSDLEETVELCHFVNGRKMDEQAETLPQNRLRLWMDFFCRRDDAFFTEHGAGDPLFAKLADLERSFTADTKLMDEYQKSEEEYASLERLINVWSDDHPAA